MNGHSTFIRSVFAGLGMFAMLALGLGVGVFIASPPETAGGDGAATPATAVAADGSPAEAPAAAAVQIYSCSMHPQIRLPEPGNCPICGMKLTPVAGGGINDGGPGRVEMSAAARALARIETVAVERRAVTMPLRLVGKVVYDETKVSRLTAWFGGRIERLYVDFTGTVVKKGDHLLAIYSPELLVAQQELLQAGRDRRSGVGMLAEVAEATYRATRDKLRLWGLQDWQIRSVERRGRPLETVTIYAPMGGIVTHKPAERGAWVQTGTPLYTIADLSRVWVALDAYESDMPWLRYGQKVRVEVDAFPGQPFDGKIAFVDPVMDERKRTIGVRVHIENPDLRLKPGMYVRAVAEVPVGGGGNHSQSDLAGTFACPMHPDIVANKPGKCSVCGMDLVAAEKHWLLGPALARGDGDELPLVIPTTAPLQTGKRVVVFVEQEGAAKPTYLVREIELGARAGDVYIVKSGLMAGERIVARGAFRLDSAIQIAGGASIMAANDVAATDDNTAKDDDAKDDAAKGNAAKGNAAVGRDATPLAAVALDAAALVHLGAAAAAALDLSAALANDSAAEAAAPAAALDKAIAALITPALHTSMGAPAHALMTASAALAATDADLEARRAAYIDVNAVLVPLVAQHQDALGVAFDHVHCPMADDNRGAGWLQRLGEVMNPYFGAQMLRCGGRKGGVAAKGAP